MDGLDRRIVKKVSGAFVDGYLYQDSLRPAAQLNEDGSIRALFVYGTRFNSPDIIIKGGVSYRVVHDHVGSPIYVINTSNSSVAQKITYDAWGNILSDSNPGFQPFGFAGGLYDSTTGLVRFGARDYDPSIGRWLNKDPIRFEGGWNLYAYVGNNPVNYADPDGLKKKFVFSEGKLTLFSDYGSKAWEGAALSGSRRLQPAPIGQYSVGDLRKNRTGAFSCSGSDGYSLNIEPLFDTDRTLLRIHPDGGRRGTAGCVGVVCSLTGGADELQKIIYDLYDQPMSPAIDLEVLFK